MRGRRSLAVSGCAPGALAAGWCGGSTEARPIAPTSSPGQQVHAVVAIPSDARRHLRGRAGRIADDIASMLDVVAGPGPDARPALRPGRLRRGDLPRHLVRPAPRAAARPTRRPAVRLLPARRSALGLGGLGNHVQEVPRLLRRPSVQANVCGDGRRRRSTPAGRTRSSGCAGAPTSRATRSPRTSSCTRSARCPTAPRTRARRPARQRPSVRLPERHPLPVRLGWPAQLARARRQPRRLLRAPGGSWLDIQDSHWLHRLDLAAGAAARLVLRRPGDDHERRAGRRLRGAAARRSGTRARASALTAVPAASDRFIRWSGSCTGNADCALKLAQAATATALFGPLRIPVRLSRAGKGRDRMRPGVRQDGSRRRAARAACAADEGLEVRALERRVQGNAAAVPPGNDLLGRRARDLHEEALSQSRSSAGAGAGVPASSARSSPTVLERSASTSCR